MNATIATTIDGVAIPPGYEAAARLLRRRGVRGDALDAAVRHLATHGSAQGCPQILVESDVDAVEATLPVSPGWASRVWDAVSPGADEDDLIDAMLDAEDEEGWDD